MGEKLLNWFLAMVARAWVLLAVGSILALLASGLISLELGFINERFPSLAVADLWEARLLFGGLIGLVVAVIIVAAVFWFVRPKPDEMLPTIGEITAFNQRGNYTASGIGGVGGIPVEVRFSFQTEDGKTAHGRGTIYMTTQELVSLTVGTTIPIKYHKSNPRFTKVPKQFGSEIK